MNQIAPNSQKRYTINDVFDENSPHVYVLNNAPRMTKEVSHVLIPYTSSQTGDSKSLELPMTHIPIDLADWAPKEELMRNPELRRLWSNGYVDFVPVDEARRVLDSAAGIAEQDRLYADRQKRNRVQVTPDENAQPTAAQQEEMNRQQQQLPAAQAGQYDDSALGVNGAVLACMADREMTDSHRLSLLRNLEPIMKDADRRYVRSQTEDAQIRKLVGG